MAASAAPIIVTGADPSMAGLDTEWVARARNLDNRAGTGKPIIFGDVNITVRLPSINTPSGSTVTNGGVLGGNLLAAFGDGFKLTGNYRIEHDGSVADESPRFEIKALSGGTIDTPVPEPATYALIGAGLIGLARLRRKRG